MSKSAPPCHRTLNWSSYNAALRRRRSLTVWFDPSTSWHAAPSGKRGVQPAYSDAAIQACPTVKVLFGLPLRQTTGFVASLLKVAGLDWPVPDFSTLCRRQRTLAVQLPYRGAGGQLQLLIDSTGIKVRGEGEWPARKHGGSKRRVWRDAIALRGAEAVVPPLRNAAPWRKASPGAAGRNADLRVMKRFGRTLWRNWPPITVVAASRRSLSGHRCMIPCRPVDELPQAPRQEAHGPRRTAELPVRIAILNRFTAIGIPVTQPVG